MRARCGPARLARAAMLLALAVPLAALARTRSTEQAPKGDGIIAGVVLDERQEPVAHVDVQAFPLETLPDVPASLFFAFPRRPSGSATTGTDGRFRMTGLPPGKFLVAAATQPLSWVRNQGGPLYATTFYPATLDCREAVPVPAASDRVMETRIELVRVRGARVSGSAASSSGRPTAGMRVTFVQGFGGFAGQQDVTVVAANGTFDIPAVPPGWYRVSIRPRVSGSPSEDAGPVESASKLIEVGESDLEGLSLVLCPGGSVSGRVLPDPGTSLPSPIGFRLKAWRADETLSLSEDPVEKAIADDWSFRVENLSGPYRFALSSDRTALEVTRVVFDGRPVPAHTGAQVAEGAHRLVLHVSPWTPPTRSGPTPPPRDLLDRFQQEKVFWRQFEIAEQIVDHPDQDVLRLLAPWLSHEDRRVRGNVAFIFARLGDPRGYRCLLDILDDLGDRPTEFSSGNGTASVARQIAADRYYAVHLLGDLRDPRAIAVLVPLLKDEEVRSVVPWALGRIGDRRAIALLVEALDDDDPSMRVLVIYALETLDAKEAVPRLVALLEDRRTSNFGARVSVAEAARGALAKLR